MKSKTCCFTGHRKLPKEECEKIRKKLARKIFELANDKGVCDFLAGGALGFDTMAAQTVIEVKKILPEIRLKLVLPCKSQADEWSTECKKIYNDILEKADDIVYLSENYERGCMHKRNRYLVDNSDYCICYLKNCDGGTAYTVEYAIKCGLNITDVGQM